MSQPIWPVVTENLAEQLSAAQGGIVHPAQLLPFLPLSLRLIEQTLDELATSDRVEKQTTGGLTTYVFKESVDRPPHKFAPTHCIYSNEPLDGDEFAVITPQCRQQIEAELAQLAQNDAWPAEAIREHELVYLANNLPSPVSTSNIAGHSRLPFKKVERYLANLRACGAIRPQSELNSWELPPLRYPKPAYQRNDTFIRQFPGAVREELEVRVIEGLSIALIILLFCFILAVTAKLPFPLILFGGPAVSAIVFFRIFKAAPKPIPEI